MKNQFNIHDLPNHPLYDNISYIADEMGFILYTKNDSVKSIDHFGPYMIEQYILLEILSKQEVAQNVINYYRKNKEQLEQCLEAYDEAKGKGFICWRFLFSRLSSSKSPRKKQKLES